MRLCTITGAAAGIGRAIALRFGREGFSIHGIDVDAQRAAEVTVSIERLGAKATFSIVDLSSKEGVDAALDDISSGPPVDVFVQNAGINAVGRFAASDLADHLAVIRLNLLTPMLMTSALLRGKKIRSGGTIAVVSSLSHFVSYPSAAAYAASKDGLASYARSLSVGLVKRNIHVLTIYPGPTRTAHARRHSPDNTREHKRMSPEVVADQVFRAVMLRRRVLVPGLRNKFFAAFGHFLPNFAERAMAKGILKKLDAICRKEDTTADR